MTEIFEKQRKSDMYKPKVSEVSIQASGFLVSFSVIHIHHNIMYSVNLCRILHELMIKRIIVNNLT